MKLALTVCIFTALANAATQIANYYNGKTP